jgi:hypothetical protein
MFQTLSGCNTSTPPASFWVRWQGWPLPPPLHFREEAVSLKLVEEKFCELRRDGVLRSSTSAFKSSRKSVKNLRIIGHLRDALYVLGLVD